jgi:hypothetical protein
MKTHFKSNPKRENKKSGVEAKPKKNVYICTLEYAE